MNDQVNNQEALEQTVQLEQPQTATATVETVKEETKEVNSEDRQVM